MPLLLWLLAAILAITPDEYRERRARLRAALPDAGVVLFAMPDTSGDPRSPMLQEPNFYYLTGLREPGAILLLLPDADVLFLPPHNERKERYEGKRAAAGDPGVEESTGFAKVLSTDVWEAEAKQRLAHVPKVYALTQRPDGDAVKRKLGRAEVSDAAPAIARLRMIKSARELDLLRYAIEVTGEAHLAAWKRARSGLREYQIVATMTEAMLERGCERHAYRPIAGSGPNSVILHYSANGRRMDRGEVLLMDVGAECSAYAADITRTIPVGGKFTQRQRELYQIVLGAQKAAIAAVKPGETLGQRGSLTQVAKDYMDAHGEPVNGKPLSSYFTHGIGHHVGLEVHDANITGDPLGAGMVITIEPGLYIPEEGIGIRIEDMVLVTVKGGRVLSSGIPKEASEIEKRMAR